MHLPVGSHDFRTGREDPNLFSTFFNGGNTVVDIKNLSAASEFPRKRGCDQIILHLSDHSMDRKSPHRSSRDRAQIAQSGHGHVQCPGDRCRGHCENIHRGTDRLELFFVLDSEPLFLIDDDKSQIVKFHPGSDKRVSSDDDIDAAGLKAFQYFFAFLAHLQPGERFDHVRICRKPFRETQKMLLGENGRRDENGSLFP